MPDPREPYGQIFHEQGRLTVNAEREKPFGVEPWEKRTEEEKELDMRGASAVAAQAVHDAGLETDRLRMQLLALTAWLPIAREALAEKVEAAEHAGHESVAKHYRAALQALGGGEGTGHG